MYASREFTKNGMGFVSLSCSCGGEEREIWVAPGSGMNLCRFTSGGRNVIDFEPWQGGPMFFGTPLLYPTPNRVYHGVFRYKGREYPQAKGGKAIAIHGLVRDELFDGVAVGETGGGIEVSAHKDFEPGNELYASFPFRHRLTVRYALSGEGVRFGYEIENRDDKEIPYGIALHPYFMKLGGEEGTRLRAPFDSCYENIAQDLIPTGRLLPVEGTPFDIRAYKPVGGLELDTVYTGNTGNLPASVRYEPLGLEVILERSPEFTHMVVYTPPGKPHFCLENQSCATDAHNLYDKGFREASGLKFVPAGEKCRGYIFYRLRSIQ
jgi:aldose 1-epimerase